MNKFHTDFFKSGILYKTAVNKVYFIERMKLTF